MLFSSIGILGLYRIETLGPRLSVKSIESKPWINGGCYLKGFQALVGQSLPKGQTVKKWTLL